MLRFLKVAMSHLRQAAARLDDASDALHQGNYPYAVRLSQECVELSLKAALRAVGVEYPKVHEVSPALRDVGDRFPRWFKEEIDFMAESSRLLFKKREPSFYGDETGLLSPEELMGLEDAEDAVRRAERIHAMCKRLVSEIEDNLSAT